MRRYPCSTQQILLPPIAKDMYIPLQRPEEKPQRKLNEEWHVRVTDSDSGSAYNTAEHEVISEIVVGMERDLYLQQAPLQKDDTIVSRLYRNVESVTTRRPRWFTVPITLPGHLSEHPQDLYDFFVLVKYDKGWISKPARYETAATVTAERPRGRIDLFFVVMTPLEEQVTIDPEGGTYVSRYDQRVKIEIPPGAITRRRHFRIKMNVAMFERFVSYKSGLPEVCGAITGVSHHLSVEQWPSGRLRREAKVTLPIFSIDGSNRGDNVYCIHRHNDVTEVLPASRSGCYSVILSTFSRQGLVQKETDKKLDSFKADGDKRNLEEASEYIYRERGVFKVMTFMRYDGSNNTLDLYFVCTKTIMYNIGDLVDEYSQLGLRLIEGSVSAALSLTDNDRIDVRVSGNLATYNNARLQSNARTTNFPETAIDVLLCLRSSIAHLTVTIGDPYNDSYVSFSFPHLGHFHHSFRLNTGPGPRQLASLRESLVLSEDSLAVLSRANLNINQWKAVAKCLAMDTEMSNRMTTLHRHGPENYAHEMLCLWNSRSRVSVRTRVNQLANAFRSVGEHRIARDIRKAYKALKELSSKIYTRDLGGLHG